MKSMLLSCFAISVLVSAAPVSADVTPSEDECTPSIAYLRDQVTSNNDHWKTLGPLKCEFRTSGAPIMVFAVINEFETVAGGVIEFRLLVDGEVIGHRRSVPIFDQFQRRLDPVQRIVLHPILRKLPAGKHTVEVQWKDQAQKTTIHGHSVASYVAAIEIARPSDVATLQGDVSNLQKDFMTNTLLNGIFKQEIEKKNARLESQLATLQAQLDAERAERQKSLAELKAALKNDLLQELKSTRGN